MSATDLAAVVMAAGRGTRMRSRTPKHLHPLLGRRMLDWVLEATRPVGADPVVVVCSPGTEDDLRATTGGVALAVQREPRGTGDAVAAARSALDGFDGDVLVVSGDTPLLTPELLAGLVEAHRRERPAVTILTVEPETPRAYGRVVRDGSGSVRAIVEAADATPEQLAIRELNTSIYVFSAPDLWRALSRLDAHNAQGELYLTDTIGHLAAEGRPVAAHVADDPVVADGVNTRAELAAAAAVLRDRVAARHMDAGVSIVDPATTWIEADAELEADAVIHPFTAIRGRSRVRAGAEVGPHAVVLDAEVGEGAVVGPFCYLRPGTVLEAGAKAGTFVEIKNSRIGERTKVPHLSYIGDAEIGEDTNVGAGAITANFPHRPGQPKGRTTIGRDVRVGVHNAFVAPVEIGDESWTAAGTVVTDDVPPGSLAGFPPRQVTKEGYVRRDRNDD
ncbi:MAG TPA: bifunctional UDP-N-acetylglucosamine diphosphorylase/glucosamine-1-phosphate N-acetyltransferase GlmU [Gaiellaceae bacterium]|nr:bifunctional UDP-N-acetylglucosamine diphosphorylase/glucosamine-1-phosphate N-acetyltransferase GlmU [Gaiellaceae bacterium]